MAKKGNNGNDRAGVCEACGCHAKKLIKHRVVRGKGGRRGYFFLLCGGCKAEIDQILEEVIRKLRINFHDFYINKQGGNFDYSFKIKRKRKKTQKYANRPGYLRHNKKKRRQRSHFEMSARVFSKF